MAKKRLYKNDVIKFRDAFDMGSYSGLPIRTTGQSYAFTEYY